MLWQDEVNKARQIRARNNDFKFGVLDDRGVEKIPFIYDWIWALENGLYKVEIKDKVGFIDTLGGIVIPILYDNIDEFNSRGRARAFRNNSYIYIDRVGVESSYYC
jgi:hypothetical protein